MQEFRQKIKNDGIVVISLFDGISCGQLALEKSNIKVKNYYASEIKKNAIKVTQHHFPNTIQIGDVTKVHYKNGMLYTENGNYKTKIDMLIGGSPCQNFSIARTISGNKRDGLNGDKSKLFYEYLRLLKEIKPKYFLLENVKMNKEYQDEISSLLNVKPIFINSKLVSYQSRPRLYWTNIPNVTVPKDKHINFQDYKDTDYEYCKKFKVNKTPSRFKMWGNGINGTCINITHKEKISCITLKQDRLHNSGLIEFDDFCRFLTTRELEIGQTLPVGYTSILTKNQSENVIGDCWTVDVIAHIFNSLHTV